MQDIENVCLPLLSLYQEQITKYLESYLPKEEIPRLLDILRSCESIGKSNQIIIENYPPQVFDALLALSYVLEIIKGLGFVENPDHTIFATDAIGIATRMLVAGFNFARAIDEDMAQSILEYNAKFLNAGKRPRTTIDALDEVLEEIVDQYYQKKNKLPNWREVVSVLEKLAKQGHSVIQEVEKDNEDEGGVFWKGSSEHDPSTFKRIRERLTPIRKKYSPSK
jgi:hypothetical protein